MRRLNITAQEFSYKIIKLFSRIEKNLGRFVVRNLENNFDFFKIQIIMI